MPKIIARSMDGVHVPFQILRPSDNPTQNQIPLQTLQTESTLAHSQRALLTKFRKPMRSTWATIVIDGVTYNEPDSKPFVELQEGMVIQVCFQPAREQVAVRLMSYGQVIPVIVSRSAYLIDVRDILSIKQPRQWPWPNTAVLLCPDQQIVFDYLDDLSLRMFSMQQDDSLRLCASCQFGNRPRSLSKRFNRTSKCTARAFNRIRASLVAVEVHDFLLAHRHDAWDEPFVDAADFDMFYVESSTWLMMAVHTARQGEEERSQYDRRSLSSPYVPNVAWRRESQ